MGANRHLGRIIVIQTLYEYEMRKASKDPMADVDKIMAKNIVPYKEAVTDAKFVRELVEGVDSHTAELDEILQPIAPEWPISSISPIDRNVLRLGLFEMLHRQDDVPAKVAINEAVELAKMFGSDNSSRFVNGVLGTAYRTLIDPAGQGESGEKTSKSEPESKAGEGAKPEQTEEQPLQ
ncbi:MAG: transcription antitermination factor NusB [Candidatus Nomurabacteria bacterium]|jgi:N utilization substance protein B|nr:transcription antitermination factor NusB [Candidatus Nomurabacteria bacterium]